MTVIEENGGRMMSLFGKTIINLEKSLDYASLKNQTISNNIANADTSNYKAKRVVFKELLDNEVNSSFVPTRTHEKHLLFQNSTMENSFKVVTDRSTSFNHNGNNVDIDKEMTELAKNQIYYQALVDRISGKFNSLQTVIKGGR